MLVANALSATYYVSVVTTSHIWWIPAERKAGIHSVTGEPFIWAIAVVPIFALFFLADLIWGALIVQYRDWRSGRFWLSAGVIWIVALWIDFAHH